uniref:Uncharacterized protein n=1 Tax=Rhodosorus marinus TaxID=101924 RepID=A0A7S0BLR5_9RHOD|mmetsp:Transcript_21429/g.31196  ORF Transcript_21429/g.31196 Transcript_21429/m.31196 type:complete len:335 (+) Transcript_21429:140-1144(+)|eukprot:CAMPEP_0184749202 /NCGR_PEP_ID=MMETSP0315-20130426/26412_1 /TAXON_ID=101924 /ORGANISM="Rhodosorus marinus, Strain UTEX LB 2760" /LENGTH=334 /DNA_ID=CAMNT_0027225881 /DNA_START=85 /DNA_END=1089 /DNA_ORIENTATION=-
MSTAEDVPIVLSVLVKQCKIDVRAAMQLIPSLLSSGVKDESSLRGLSDSKLKKVVPDAKIRRKILAGLKKKPAGATKASPSKAKAKPGKEAAAEAHIVEPEARTLTPADLKALEVVVNRSPLMILWACSVAKQRGFDWNSCLSLAQASADWYARKKGEYHGILQHKTPPTVDKSREDLEEIELVGVRINAVRKTEGKEVGYRALDDDGREISPSKPWTYIRRNFGANLEHAYGACRDLSEAIPMEELVSGPTTYSVYEKFRPDVAYGAAGWGSRGRIKFDQLLLTKQVYHEISQMRSKGADMGWDAADVVKSEQEMLSKSESLEVVYDPDDRKP